MALRTIITYPHPILRQKAEPITVFDQELKDLVSDMTETMYHAPGIGLAANQIGVALQVVVVDCSSAENKHACIALVNPVISSGEDRVDGDEGCLSVLECYTKIERFRKIHVAYQDVDGNHLEFDAEDRFARIIQHEVDHLRGILLLDRLSVLKRALYKKRLKKILQECE
jgi:peptide deformylase